MQVLLIGDRPISNILDTYIDFRFSARGRAGMHSGFLSIHKYGEKLGGTKLKQIVVITGKVVLYKNLDVVSGAVGSKKRPLKVVHGKETFIDTLGTVYTYVVSWEAFAVLGKELATLPRY